MDNVVRALPRLLESLRGLAADNGRHTAEFDNLTHLAAAEREIRSQGA